MLDIRGLEFIHHRKQILSDINLSVNDGEIIGIIGSPGSGKTVLMNILAGRLKGHTGDISVNNAPLDSYSRWEKNRIIASLIKNEQLNYNETLCDFLLLSRIPHKKILRAFSDYDVQITEEYIAGFELAEYKDKELLKLPESVLKRGLLAFTFIRDAYILLLDNPAALLDLKSVYLLRRAVSRYVFNGNRIVIISSNDINFVLQTADRIVVLDSGSIAETGTPDIVNSGMVKKYFGIEVMVSRNIYNGRPEIHFFPSG